jgi:nucleoid DNA-binding protein
MNPLVNHKELVALVADRCEYHKYEVDDVIRSLVVVLAQQVRAGNTVELMDVGTVGICPRHEKERTIKDLHGEGDLHLPERILLAPKFQLSAGFIQAVKDGYSGSIKEGPIDKEDGIAS